MTYRRCPGCRTFYDKKLGDCPDCGHAPAVFSSHLERSRLDGHLFRQAESADRDRKLYRALKQGYEIPPSKQQQKMAKEIVRDLL